MRLTMFKMVFSRIHSQKRLRQLLKSQRKRQERNLQEAESQNRNWRNKVLLLLDQNKF